MSNSATATATATSSLPIIGIIWAGLIFTKIFEVPAMAGVSWWFIAFFPFIAFLGIMGFILILIGLFLGGYVAYHGIANYLSARKRRLKAGGK